MSFINPHELTQAWVHLAGLAHQHIYRHGPVLQYSDQSSRGLFLSSAAVSGDLIPNFCSQGHLAGGADAEGADGVDPGIHVHGVRILLCSNT